MVFLERMAPAQSCWKEQNNTHMMSHVCGEPSARLEDNKERYLENLRRMHSNTKCLQVM